MLKSRLKLYDQPKKGIDVIKYRLCKKGFDMV
jgi:hypothetical protein